MITPENSFCDIIPEKNPDGNYYRGVLCRCGRLIFRSGGTTNHSCQHCGARVIWGERKGNELFERR